MKKLRLLTLSIAAIAMVGMFACTSTGKTEESKEVTEEVVEKDAPCEETAADSTVVADTVAVADTAIVEETPAE